ncbi:3-oxoacyl-ACP synthase [uncultured Algibacter sp.]|jgi:transcription elongation GreA/GreB family factor|uniref:3-oxoacyl-ACP synthase n=1 Tax=uncultured Algibacter sp. TaxID=298659 RepID=UPI002632E870|nr:3-oxoacyl-ACP synthase [uncultured Algibacter sp.]
MNIKKELYNQCFEFIENRYQAVQNTIKEIQVSLRSETKSSAGDKHETGRAMLQLEREKAGVQLAEIEKTKALLSKVNIENNLNKIGVGSVVFTTKSNYFIAISAGELKAKGDNFFAISANTPMGQLLIGKAVGDVISFRAQAFKVTKVL